MKRMSAAGPSGTAGTAGLRMSNLPNDAPPELSSTSSTATSTTKKSAVGVAYVSTGGNSNRTSKANQKIQQNYNQNQPGVASVSNTDRSNAPRRSKLKKSKEDERRSLERLQRNILPDVEHVPSQFRRSDGIVNNNAKAAAGRLSQETMDLDEELGGFEIVEQEISNSVAGENGDNDDANKKKNGDDNATKEDNAYKDKEDEGDEEDLPIAIEVDDEDDEDDDKYKQDPIIISPEQQVDAVDSAHVAVAEIIVPKKWYQLRSTQGIFCVAVTAVTILVAVLLTLPDGGGPSVPLTSAPSISTQPSPAPSISAQPSDMPTNLPSVSPTSDPSASPSAAPTLVRFEDVTTALVASGVTSEGALNTENSVQSQARNWVTFDDVMMVDPATNAAQLVQRYVLAVFHFSSVVLSAVDGVVPLSPWLSDEEECNWEGVKCNVDGNIIEFVLDAKNLEGIIPPELLLLPNLTGVNLQNNEFSAMATALPGEKFSAIELLYLGENKIFHEFPNDVILRMPNLRELQVKTNIFSGELSADLPNACPNIEVFVVSNNRINGDLPPTFGSFSKLQRFEIDNNFLVNGLPSEIGLLSLIEYFDVTNNKLTGLLPSEIGQWPFASGLLKFGQNSFTGALPTELGNIGKAVNINLDRNRFSSTIPSELGQLRKTLHYLYLHENDLTGTVPDEIGNLTNLNVLFIQKNSLTGTIAEGGPICALQSLTTLWLDCVIVCECCTSECY
uniref:Leucine-rich repeat-containing N-terminal plant-type domain-containing protein n=1 Tax=Leptocylindrus danicus TaxID=163516 RepID=A0A7S2KME8_9STRA